MNTFSDDSDVQAEIDAAKSQQRWREVAAFVLGLEIGRSAICPGKKAPLLCLSL
jgi:hypothetical protein